MRAGRRVDNDNDYMVSTECIEGNDDCRIVIQPNRSLSWRQSQWFILAVSLLLGVVSLGFGLLGYWLVFPFAGAEVGLLAWCTWRVVAQGYRCEVVSIGPDEVAIEKGRQRRAPDTRVSFPRAWFRVEMRKPRGWYPRRLLVGASGRWVELGHFLAEEEKQALADELNRLLARA